MPSIDFVTPEEHRAALRRIERLEQLLTAHVTGQPEWLSTEDAVRVAGIRRETLVKYARAVAPHIAQEGRITFKKDGVKCFYLKSSCIDYAQRKKGLPTLQAAA